MTPPAKYAMMNSMMVTTFLLPASLTAYLGAAGLQGLALREKRQFLSPRTARWGILGLATLAVILHGALLHRWIDHQSGQNLNTFNILSQAAWFLSVFWICLTCKKSLHLLGLVVLPLTALTLVLPILFPSAPTLFTDQSPLAFVHIFLAFTAFALLALGAGVGLLATLSQTLLRGGRFTPTLKQLPSLEALEQFHTKLIFVGWASLTGVLATGLILFDHPFESPLLEKTLLSLFAWGFFAALLAGRKFFGWRGKKSLMGSLFGIILLTVIYSLRSLLL